MNRPRRLKQNELILISKERPHLECLQSAECHDGGQAHVAIGVGVERRQLLRRHRSGQSHDAGMALIRISTIALDKFHQRRPGCCGLTIAQRNGGEEPNPRRLMRKAGDQFAIKELGAGAQFACDLRCLCAHFRIRILPSRG